MKRILSVLLALVMIVGMIPMSILSASAADTTVVFEFGANGSATHKDGSTAKTTHTETNGNYTLSITNGNKMYPSSYDAKGNSCIKLGSSSAVGGFTFTVPNDVTQVVISAAKYKTNTTKFSVNGTTYTLTKSSNDGAYDEITVDTTTDKTVTVTTVSGGVRAMVNSIVFRIPGGETDEPECTHANTVNVDAVAATCTEAGKAAGVICSDCNEEISGFEPIAALGHTEDAVVTDPSCTEAGFTTYTCSVCGNVRVADDVNATGHNYVDNVCTGCGKEKGAAVATLITSKDDFVSGEYVLVVSSGYAMGAYDNETTWVLPVQPEIIDGEMLDTANGVWTLTVDGTSVTIKDANGAFIAPKGGNNNGIKSGEYSWAWSVNEDGTFVFAGVDTDTVKLASNTDGTNGLNRFRGYKTTTVDGDTKGTYLANFSVYKLNKGGEVEPEEPTDPTEPAGEHDSCDVADVVAKEATCTEDGNTAGKYCNDCDEYFDGYEVIEALGHNYVDGTCSACGAKEPAEEEGGYAKATAISVGDKIIIVSEKAGMELSSFSTTSTVYGIGTAYTDIPAGTMTWTVEEGTVAGSYAFKNGDGNYLYWSSGNSLKTSTTKDAQASWTVAFNGNDVTMVIAGTSDAARHIAWNSGSPRFANYKDSTTSGSNGSGYYAIQFYKYEVVGACAHSWGEWVTTTAPTCTTAGVQTATCTLCNNATTTQPIPATGHTYTYTNDTMACVCGDTKQINTIADAKAYTSTTQVYYIKGIVTYVNAKNVYMQDATGGICVYFATANDAAGIAVGDEIVVWDTMTKYSGLIETTNTTAKEYMKVSSGNELPSEVVTIADLNADTTNEYLGERVVIENVTIGVLGTNNTALTDANGNTINIYKAPDLSEDIKANDVVTVTAIVSTYNGYQLALNSAADVVKVASGEEEVVETVTIAEAKAGTAGEYYQVEGTVTYISGRNVYIQDATGGIVVYLTANAATTQVGDNVKAYGALKVYNGLIELDAVDETNAEFYSILSSGNAVEAQQTSIAGLLADTTNEYLAEKVTLNNVYVSHYSYNSSYGNVTYTLTDGNGNTIQIYRVTVASEAECVAKGSIVNVEAVVSAYNGYQLVTSSDKITVTGTCAHETTQLVNYVRATCTEGGYSGDTECVVCGVWTARGADTAATGHSYTTSDGVCANGCGVNISVALTHISLHPGKDALGYKAAATNAPEGAKIQITLWVSESKKVTKVNDTVRLVNILANNGGETIIYAKAELIDATGNVIATSAEAQTTMKETVELVEAAVEANPNAYSAEQMTAVQALIAKFESKMTDWNIDAIKAWKAPSTEQ